MAIRPIFLSQVYSFYFVLIFAHLFMVVWGFGVGILDRVFGVEIFNLWGLEPVVWGLLGFQELGLSI